jgi:predicted ribosome-associated RNA-binding protein Tma20
MNNAGNMAFIHFQKNYTKDLIKYIDQKYDEVESNTYIHLTNESKYKIWSLNGNVINFS